jgi:2-oxoglutarate ferredoxin oxidoreductase subunit gamma
MRVRLSEIRVAGFGGQGVIMCASVIGKAASVFDGGFATMTQAFGPEARGGACSAQVILSSDAILYPYVSQPDVLVVMSQEAYSKFAPELKPGGLMLIEEELVKLTDLKPGVRVYGIPATRLAEELGKKMVLNIVMTGFFAAITGLVRKDSLRDAVADSVPPSFRDLNIKAFDTGSRSSKRKANSATCTLPRKSPLWRA